VKQPRRLLIYNLFPLLYGHVERWQDGVGDALEMGFNTIYLNPFHEVGASGSLYAVRDYYRYNLRFFTSAAAAETELRDFVGYCRDLGLDVFMDLVANHSAIDSPLVARHGEWYVHDESGAVQSPSTIENWQRIAWLDLAKYDHYSPAARKSLWPFLVRVCLHYCRLGFTGFRCDAAYHCPTGFWSHLIEHVKAAFPDTLFIAETFMSPLDRIGPLVDAGFDYVFNSSKWWNYRDPWCLEQHRMTFTLAPSISVPETHDSPRLMAECGGREDLFLQRLTFTAFFSSGFLIPSGLERGVVKQLDCVATSRADWDTVTHDFRDAIRRIVMVKQRVRTLREEGRIDAVSVDSPPLVCLVKTVGSERSILLINTNESDAQSISADTLRLALNSARLYLLQGPAWSAREHSYAVLSISPARCVVVLGHRPPML
jgi:starch synthase (maltosyl-transferring)